MNAEFHLLTTKNIKSYEDLRGRKVNFWNKKSITSLAAEIIFDALNIEVEPVYLDNAAAIEKMRTGEIAAVARMSGAPHNDYNSVTANDEFHLLPLDIVSPSGPIGKTLSSVYLPAQLTSDDYPQLIPAGQHIETVATIIVLATYNWPEKTERYEKVANFVRKFFDNIEKFRHPARHPKWSEINLSAQVSGWQRFKPAQEWLNQNAQKQQTLYNNSELRSAFEKFSQQQTSPTGSALSETDRNAMFDEFVRWWQSQKQNAR